MVAEGKVNAEEGARLLEALNPKKVNKRSRRHLHILITEEGNKKPKLNLSIPVKLAEIGMKFIPKNSEFKAHLGNSNFDFSSINWKEIMELVSSGEVGDLLNLEVDEENKPPTIIRIFVD